MSKTILLASANLAARHIDVEAALGGTLLPSGADHADLLAFAGTQPSPAIAAEAARLGARAVGLSPAPLQIRALQDVARPLGYRISGLQDEWRDADGAAASVEARLALLRTRAAALPKGAVLLPPPGAAASLLQNCVWLDPYDRTPVTLEQALDLAEEFCGFLERGAVVPVGLNITVGKRRHIEPFVTFPRRPLQQFSRLAPAIAAARRTGAPILVWASWRHDRTIRRCDAEGVTLARVEDGFLRSVGLGAAFVRSMSLVVDSRGIYYDPSCPSDLEHLLETAEIDARLLSRAQALREDLVAANLTKYNVGRAAADAEPLVPPGRVGVLVPGQVEDDASILRGSATVRSNLALIEAARARWPDAFLIYKPHPDVEAGYRVGKVADADALRFCDRIVRDRSIADLFGECAAVETMTSLAGFEALLRGLKVATHGQPFYSGWGLTDDLAPHPRRTRRRSLDELVAAALILYPRYVDPVSGLPCGPELVIRRLAQTRARLQQPGRWAPHLRHGLALARHRVLGPLLRLLK
jgi:capsular polysaccharide export protein